MEGTAQLHHEIPDTIFEQPDDLLYNPASFDTAHYVLDAHSPLRELTVEGFLLCTELSPTGLFDGHDGLYSLEVKGKESQVLQKRASYGKRIRGGIGNRLIVHLTLNRIAQKQHPQTLICEEHIFHRVALFLTAVVEFLFILVLGTEDSPLGSVMTKRGPPEEEVV